MSGDDGRNAGLLAAVGGEVGQGRHDATVKMGDIDPLVPQDFGHEPETARGEGDVEGQQWHVEAVHADAVDLGRAVDGGDHDDLVAGGAQVQCQVVDLHLDPTDLRQIAVAHEAYAHPGASVPLRWGNLVPWRPS